MSFTNHIVGCRYNASVAVALVEMVKLIVCLFIVVITVFPLQPPEIFHLSSAKPVMWNQNRWSYYLRVWPVHHRLCASDFRRTRKKNRLIGFTIKSWSIGGKLFGLEFLRFCKFYFHFLTSANFMTHWRRFLHEPKQQSPAHSRTTDMSCKIMCCSLRSLN